ncbi:MAG: hypothetical protein K6T34_08870 [Thermoflavifilum sp.]|nr:hypothetical protein [Thermoflavifilum sp.]
MDIRVTVSHPEAFLPILQECLANRQPASIIYEQQGLQRAEGCIQSIDQGRVWLEDGQSIALEQLVAVNGVFIDSYAQC